MRAKASRHTLAATCAETEFKGATIVGSEKKIDVRATLEKCSERFTITYLEGIA